MNNKRDKYTSKLQLEAMVDLMKLNRDVACGFSQRAPAEIKKFWEDLALTLNGSGPPLKDASGWRKVWTDYKSGVKKKLSKNRQLLSGTGGGPYREIPLNETEEEVSTLLNLNAAVHGIPNVNNFGISSNPLQKMDAVLNRSEKDLSVEINVTHETDLPVIENITRGELVDKEVSAESSSSANVRFIPSKINKKEQKIDLLKEQIKIQKKLALDVAGSLESLTEQNKENFKIIKDMKRAIYSLGDEKKKQTKILEQQLQEQKRHNEAMEKLLSKKISLKEQILLLEIEKIDKQLQ